MAEQRLHVSPHWALRGAAALAGLAMVAAPASQAADAKPAGLAGGAEAECRDDPNPDCVARKRREQEQREATRSTDGGREIEHSARDIVPCTGTTNGAVCGINSDIPTVALTPLTIRRVELSAGIDHALSAEWVWGGLVGAGKGRLHRTETITPSNGGKPTIRDTTVRTRDTSLASTLTWFPTRDLAVDGTLSYQRSSFDFARQDVESRLFIGKNAGHAWGVSVNAARSWRSPRAVLVPQVGLNWVSSTVEPLFASIPNPPPGSVDNFSVGEQKVKTLSALLGLQVQWPRSQAFGVLVPYARAAWRQRLSQSSAPVPIKGDLTGRKFVAPDTETGRRAGTIGLGLLAQWPGGVALFGDLAVTRAAGDVRETRLAFGIKFER
jgi:hypothetical protein